MKTTLDRFDRTPIISPMPDVTYAQVPFWFYGTMKPLKMDILLPKHKQDFKPQPTLVWICGGAYQQIDRHIWIPELVWFAKHGFTVASIEYRTSMEASWPAQIIDVKAAIRYLKAHAAEFCIDPDKIAIAGESAGGHLACMAGTAQKVPEFESGENLEYSSAVQAVVDFYGISEMAEPIGGDDINHGNPEELLIGCSYQSDPQKYESASPLHYVSPECPPFLILHGDQDPLVSIEQSHQLYSALEKANVHVEMDIYAGVGHGADEFYQDSSKKRILEFLNKYLK